VGQI